MLVGAVSNFINNPNEYLLQLEKKDGITFLSEVKKDIWLWLKIKVLSHIGLYNKSVLSINQIAVEARGLKNNDDLLKAIDFKISNYNRTREDDRKIQNVLKNSNVVKVSGEHSFEAWTKMQDGEVSEAIIQKLSNKGTYQVFAQSLDSNNKDLVSRNVEGDNNKIIVIRRQTSNHEVNGLPNLEIISRFFDSMVGMNHNLGNNLDMLFNLKKRIQSRCWSITRTKKKLSLSLCKQQLK